MPDKDKPAEPEFKTAAEVYGVGRDQPPPIAGLSQSPGLRALEDSPVPGTLRSHVIGPGQAAADPVLAGLDTAHNPLTRAEDRVITRTDGSMVVPPPDTASDALVGPSGTSAPAAAGAREAAERVTPTVAVVADPVLVQPNPPAVAETDHSTS